MRVKKLFLLLLVFSVLLSEGALAATEWMSSTEKENIYQAAILELETFLQMQGNSAQALDGVAGAFSSLGGYAHSSSFYYFSIILQKVNREEYDDYLALCLDILEHSRDFQAYLEENRKSASFGTFAQLKSYVQGREAEWQGNDEKAVDRYQECMNFYDTTGRYIKIKTATPEPTTPIPDTPTPQPTPTPTPTPVPSVCKAGDIVTIGHYPQTSAGDDQTPIEWIVLDVDTISGRVLLISRYLLAPKAYSNAYPSTWETSTLRTWLNSEFLNAAFSGEEQRAVCETLTDNSARQGDSTWNTDGGNDTEDRLFLLSYAEAKRYFGLDGKGQGALTDYALSGGRDRCLISDTETVNGKAAGWWWLRSPGTDQSTAVCIRDDGSDRPYALINERICVRPAFWADLYAGLL